MELANKNILLIISGGIAAYKSLELIRLLRKSGADVRCILTRGGEQFVTPLSVSALSENHVYTDLWSLKDETEMGHIRLSREADLILIAPASANIIAQMAHGLADDLASTTLLAANKPILIAPAMNHMMWENPATQANIQTLEARGVTRVGPTEGDMACGEYGMGRMAEAEEIFKIITSFCHPRGERGELRQRGSGKDSSKAADIVDPVCANASAEACQRDDEKNKQPLRGLTALVTSGPTHEPLDPVRFIGNRSSGKQGHAIAAALHAAGAEVTLITGPVTLPDPAGVKTIHIQTGEEMLAACLSALPADIAVCAAAVADWRAADPKEHKIKKSDGSSPLKVAFTENPDILETLSHHKKRPRIVVGFAAETENMLENAQKKLKRKGCDFILANEPTSTFGRDENHVYLVSPDHTEDWSKISKSAIAQRLAHTISNALRQKDLEDAAE